MTLQRELPGSWRWARFDEVAEVESNLVDPNGRGDAPHVAPNHIESGTGRLLAYKTVADDGVTSGKHIFRPGQILYSKIRPYLAKAVVVDFDGLCSADMYPIRSDVEPRYLHQWLISHEFTALASRSQGRTVLPKINQDELNALPVPVPPLNEQRRIAQKVEALKARSSAAREAVEQVPTLLERFRQSVLATAFRGDLTSEWRRKNPDVEPASETVARVETPARPHKFGSRSTTIAPGDSALSVGDPGTPAPPGWQWTLLLDVARLETGHTPSRSHPEYWDGDIPWVSIPDARDNHGQVIHETRSYVTQAGLDNSAARLLPKGAVFLCRTAGSIGYTLILGREMATSQDLVAWVCTEAVYPPFLMWLLLAEKQAILRFAKGSAHKTVYFPEIMSFHVCLPSVSEQREIVRLIELRWRAFTLIDEQTRETRSRLDTLDHAVLAAAFRGELVPQDPNDEPASVLLDRIRAERGTDSTRRPGRRRKSDGEQLQAAASPEADPPPPPTPPTRPPANRTKVNKAGSNGTRLKSVLGVLKRDALHRIADAHEIELADRRSVEAAQAGITDAGLGLDAVLEHLDRDELKAVCRALRLEDRGRTKDELRDRILRAGRS